jgi:hypothetical protein
LFNWKGKDMTQESSSTTYTLPPGQDYYLVIPPTPHTPKTPQLWSQVGLVETLYKQPPEAEEVRLVKAWITQLVRRELGPALDKVDKKKKFDITSHGIDVVQAHLITKALMLRAKREFEAFKGKSKKQGK